MTRLDAMMHRSFVVIEAEWPAGQALEKMHASPLATHAIVSREGGRYFYLFVLQDILYRLSHANSNAPVAFALNLHESDSLPAVTAEEADRGVSVPCIILREGRAVGFLDPSVPPRFNSDTGSATANGPTPETGPTDGTDASGGGDILEEFSSGSGDGESDAGAVPIDDIDEFNVRSEPPLTSEPPQAFEPPIVLAEPPIFDDLPSAPPAPPSDASFPYDAGPPPAPTTAPSAQPVYPEPLPPPYSPSPPDPSPVPSAAPQRYLTAKAQERVRLQEEFALTVRITTDAVASAPGEASSALSAPVAGGIQIDIYAPGFRCLDGSTRTLQAPAAGNSAPVRFGLRAEKAGAQSIEISAWNGAAHVGGLTLQVAVEVDPIAEAATAAGMDMRDPEAGECTLEVIFDTPSNRYRFQLRGEDLGVMEPVYSEPLVGSYQQTVQGLVSSLNEQARNVFKFTPAQTQIFLRAMGSLLYENIVPDDLKQALWGIRDRIQRLNILSPGDPMPWEMLFLSDAQTGQGAFLAETATVARWRYGAPAPKKLHRSPAYIVAPTGAPPQAAQEYQTLNGILGGANRISEMDALLALIQAGSFGVLHFAAHNVSVPDVAGGSYVPFPPTRFPLTFMGAVPRNRYRTDSPLVFMNACTSAGASPLYTEMAGWADRFLLCGSAAFIGSLWEIRDVSAAKFSEAFYGALCGGKNLGEAMKSGREAIGTADPTRLAYTLYGDPLARI